MQARWSAGYAAPAAGEWGGGGGFDGPLGATAAPGGGSAVGGIGDKFSENFNLNFTQFYQLLLRITQVG